MRAKKVTVTAATGLAIKASWHTAFAVARIRSGRILAEYETSYMIGINANVMLPVPESTVNSHTNRGPITGICRGWRAMAAPASLIKNSIPPAAAIAADAQITASTMKIAPKGGAAGCNRSTSTMMKTDRPAVPISAIGPYFAPTTSGIRNRMISKINLSASTPIPISSLPQNSSSSACTDPRAQRIAHGTRNVSGLSH